MEFYSGPEAIRPSSDGRLPPSSLLINVIVQMKAALFLL